MGRIGAKPIHQFQVQPQNGQHQLEPHQEYSYQVESSDHHQAHDTIDELPPQSVEPFHEDLYPEESRDEPSQEQTMQSESQENQHQYVLVTPQPISRPVTTQFSQQNGKTQRPRKKPQPQSGTLRTPLQPSQHNSFPVHDPQPQAEAFPPPQSQPSPHTFPPAQDYYDPHTFPPMQEEEEEAYEFPPTVPQAFPPAQDYYEPHDFPPTLEEGEDFPPTPTKARAFPPPQIDPQLYPPQAKPQAFVPQNHNVPAFASSQPQAGANFPQHSLAQGSQIGMGMGQYPQGMPSASPVMGIPSKPILPTESWKTGLFGCMEDPTNALITACFPCLTFGQIAEIVDSGQNTCTTSGLIYGAIMFIAMPCIMSCTYRTKLRSQYGLIESPAPDWVIHCFCECCALCQEYRELHLRGLDPSIGWQGNQARKQNMQLQQATMVPPVHQAMMG